MGGTCDFHPKKWHHGHHGHRKKKHDTSYPPFVVSWTCWAESLFARTDTWLVYDHHLTFQTFQVSVLAKECLGGGFKQFFMFIPISGRFPIWLIFFRWGETTNQMICVWWTFLCIWRCVTFYLEEPFPKKMINLCFSGSSEFWEFTKLIALLVIQLLPQPKSGMYVYLGGGFKDFLFSFLFGEDFQFDSYFSNGLVQSPTRYGIHE